MLISAVEQEEFAVKEEESTIEQESKQIEIAITAEENVESDLDIALSESDASQTQAEIQLDLESDKSEVDFVVDTTDESEVHETTEVKLSITQETEDADVSLEIKEENVENVKISIEG